MNFKKRNIIETELPEAAPETEQNEPPRFPALRTFRVRRYVEGELESTVVSAHILNYPYENVIAFLDYVLDPITGPQARVHDLMHGYVDVKDISGPDTTEGTTVQ